MDGTEIVELDQIATLSERTDVSKKAFLGILYIFLKLLRYYHTSVYELISTSERYGFTMGFKRTE